jgi:hypothetical protein
MQGRGWLLLSNALLLLIAFPASSFCQTAATSTQEKADTAKANEKKDQRQIERDQWTIYYAQQIPRYTFYLDSDKETPLEFDSDAKLRYWNSIRAGNNHGELFIWTHNGRCALAGSILSYEKSTVLRGVGHEFHSFSSERIVGTRDNSPIEMSAPGVEFKVIPGAKPPAKSRALRMAQLRRNAKSFEASTVTTQGVSQPLRALSQPIFRYKTKEISNDGAIFAYVTGTDPELLVAIESRETKDGPKWHFAAARFTDLPITLKHKNKVIWEFDEEANYKGGYKFEPDIDLQPFSPNIEEQETTVDETNIQQVKEASK